jgi:hypothetical protein
MAIEPETWLELEQAMEQENHALLQHELTEPEKQQTPQLLMIFSHAARGTTTAATFSLIVSMGGKQGVALVDGGSTDTFMDYH